jgi:hypothetical protein
MALFVAVSPGNKDPDMRGYKSFPSPYVSTTNRA